MFDDNWVLYLFIIMVLFGRDGGWVERAFIWGAFATFLGYLLGLWVQAVMMPGSLDGYQVCQKIRQEPGLCNIPVILLTARGQQADFEMGRQAGADAYLTKPFSPLELIDTVDSQLARTVGAHA